MSEIVSESEREDIELMLRVKEGDDAAFEKLVKKHQHGVYNIIKKMLGSSTDAEDIAQEAFVRIYRASRHYTPSAKFSTWLFTIVKNVAFNEIRRRGRRIQRLQPSQNSEPARESEVEKAHDSSSTPAESILRQELESQIQHALASLPEQQRMALILLRYEDLSYEEIAKILKISVGALKSLIFRARETLRNKLAHYL